MVISMDPVWVLNNLTYSGILTFLVSGVKLYDISQIVA